jgi:flagellar motility protein MotE (MotC chaperone)
MMKLRFRLLPAVIFLAAFAAVLKLGSAWQGLDGSFASAAVAEEKPDAGAPAAGSADPEGEEGGGESLPPAQEAVGADGDAGAGTAKAGGDGRGEKTGNAVGWFDPASVTDAELEVLQKLSARRTELETRDKALEVRARLLEATERRIDGKIAELKKIRDTIGSLLKQHDEQKEEQMKSVVKIYEAMKPKEAARIFEELDMAILLDVVERMSERRTAPIMANMTPAKAKAMTAALAQRRDLPKAERRDRQ